MGAFLREPIDSSSSLRAVSGSLARLLCVCECGRLGVDVAGKWFRDWPAGRAVSPVGGIGVARYAMLAHALRMLKGRALLARGIPPGADCGCWVQLGARPAGRTEIGR